MGQTVTLYQIRAGVTLKQNSGSLWEGGKEKQYSKVTSTNYLIGYL